MFENNSQLITAIIAVYAALLSTLVALLRVLDYKKKRARGRLDCEFIEEPVSFNKTSLILFFRFTNVGGTDITIDSIHVEAGETYRLDPQESYPITLQPTKAISDRVIYNPYKIKEIKNIYVKCTLGKIYQISKENLKLIRSKNYNELGE